MKTGDDVSWVSISIDEEDILYVLPVSKNPKSQIGGVHLGIQFIQIVHLAMVRRGPKMPV